MITITIKNHGQLVTATDYWGSPHEKAGKVLCSCNAGAIRVLLPRQLFDAVNECRSSQYAICSRGLWTEQRAEGVELLFEDFTAEPFSFHFTANSFADRMPEEPKPGEEWIVSLWTIKKGKPHKALERPCKWRRVSTLPCLMEWGK